MRQHDIQDEPESTIGMKPSHQAPGSRPEEHDPFAHARLRRDEAEESELGEEIREREGELDELEVGPTAGTLAPPEFTGP